MKYNNIKVYKVTELPYELFVYLHDVTNCSKSNYKGWYVLNTIDTAESNYKKVSKWLLDNGAKNGELIIFQFSDYYD